MSRPYTKIPIIFDNWFFKTFPYILPNLVLFFLSILCFTFSAIFLKETRFTKEEKKEELIEEISNVIVEEPEKINNEITLKESTEIEEISKNDSAEEITNLEIENQTTDQTEELLINNQEEIFEESSIVPQVDFIPEIQKKTSLIQKLKSFPKYILSSNLLARAPIISTLMYSLMGMHQIVFDEVLPIWIWTPITNNGLGLVPYKIGIIQGIIGFCLFFNQFTLIPWFINKFEPKRANQLAVLIIIPFSLGIVEIYRIAKIQNIEWLIWLLLIILLQIRLIFASIAFTSVILLVNNSVPKESLGTLNGISQSAVAFTRGIGPSIATPLFAFSISGSSFFPFDVHLSFYFSAFIIALMLPFSLLLPPKKN